MNANYTWALTAFKELVFYDGMKPNVWFRDGEPAVRLALEDTFPDTPQLLWLWHVNKNVLEHIQATFFPHIDMDDEQKKDVQADRELAMARWQSVTRSITPEECTRRFEAMCSDYSHTPNFVKYLRDKQETQKELTVRAWTSLIRHFGHSVSSRLEGGHHTVKDGLEDSMGDLLTVFECVSMHLEDERSELKASLAEAFGAIAHTINPANVPIFYFDIVAKVLPLGLKHARQQYDLATSVKYSPNCSGAFTRIWGVPCCHSIHDLLERDGDGVLNATDFDARWRFDRVHRLFNTIPQAPLPQVLAPNVVKTKGRPAGIRNVNTQRAPPRPSRAALTGAGVERREAVALSATQAYGQCLLPSCDSRRRITSRSHGQLRQNAAKYDTEKLLGHQLLSRLKMMASRCITLLFSTTLTPTTTRLLRLPLLWPSAMALHLSRGHPTSAGRLPPRNLRRKPPKSAAASLIPSRRRILPKRGRRLSKSGARAWRRLKLSKISRSKKSRMLSSNGSIYRQNLRPRQGHNLERVGGIEISS
jgi:hypothetical protein